MKGTAKCHILAVLAVQLPLALLVAITLFAEKRRPALRSPYAMLAAVAVIEVLFVVFFIRAIRRGGSGFGALSIICFVWLLLLAWEICTSVTAIAHPVLIPSPENVFDTFRTRWRDMLLNIWYSMRLLLAGFITGLSAAVICGAFVGWFPRLRAFAYPIANVMTPIPPVVFSPYLVAIMPSFRSASILVIFLGVFWPTFLTTINRVGSIDQHILDTARMLGVKSRAMIFRIIFPCIFPGVISGLRVSLTTSLLMLNFAELMGASHGMGYFIQNSIAYANYTNAVAGIIVVGIVVTILAHLAAFIQRHAVKWH